MPRPDFRKLATERLSTPEPIGMRIGMLLGMSEAEFSSSGFSAPADVPFAPVSPAPRKTSTRRKTFAAAVAAVVAEPVAATSLPFLSASSPFLSATTVVETPAKPVKAVTTPVVKKPAVKKAKSTKAKTAKAKTTTTVTGATKRRTRRPAVVATPVAAPLIPVELPESALLAGLVTPAATPVLPVVSGPSPVGDLAARTTPAVAGVRSRAKTGVTDPAIASRDAVMEAFGDELSRLVELLGAPDGRPEDEHERAKVRKFLQISRIYLDNLAVRMK